MTPGETVCAPSFETFIKRFWIESDVGTFTDLSQLDDATVRHARDNPCELEFLHQWSAEPPAPWLQPIFLPEGEGLGLTCPVVMVHGNHEGFAHLERLAPGPPPAEPVSAEDLPAADTGGHILYLPSGWRFRTSGGCLVAGLGGIERGQRKANYHPMAYLNDWRRCLSLPFPSSDQDDVEAKTGTRAQSSSPSGDSSRNGLWRIGGRSITYGF